MAKVTFLIIILILLFLFIRFFEKRNLYFPLRAIEGTPKNIGLDYEEVSFETEDAVEITGWFIPAEAPRVTLIFCHGNGGNISHRLEKIRILNSLHIDVLIFDYRGYGLSKGSPSENGLYIDVETVYEYLIKVKKTPPQKVVVFGESLGAAVAVNLAYKHELAGIIIEGAFTSVKDMAKRILPFVPTFVYKSRFDSLEKIKNIESPKLIFHSVDDEIVPFEFGRKLYDAAVQPKEFVKLQGGHNDAFFDSLDIFVSKIDSFVDNIDKNGFHKISEK